MHAYVADRHDRLVGRQPDGPRCVVSVEQCRDRGGAAEHLDRGCVEDDPDVNRRVLAVLLFLDGAAG